MRFRVSISEWKVVHLHIHLAEVVGEFLGHALGEGGYEGALALGDAEAYLFQQVVDLSPGRLHLGGGVEQTRGANDLLDDLLAVLELIGGGRRRNIEGLVDEALELLEVQRAVVARGLEAGSRTR